jgi:hypothetical protein
MRMAWRWFLITWLVVALPLQGAVAATLRHCTPVLATVQTEVEAGVSQHASHHHASLHHAGHHVHSGSDAVPGHDTAPRADAAGKCSVCAACCPAMAAVMPSFEAPIPLFSAMRYSVPAAAAPPEGLPTGLERPPRLARV